MNKEKTVEAILPKLPRRSFYTDNYKFFEDVFVVAAHINQKDVVPVQMLRSIKTRILASKKHKVKSSIFKKIKPAVSLSEILVLCISISDYLKKEPYAVHSNTSKARIVDIAHQSGLDNLEKIIALTHEKKSFLFTNNIIRERGDELSLTSEMLDMILNKKPQPAAPAPAAVSYNPSQLYTQLSKYVISQDRAKKDFCVAVFEHLLRCHVRATSKVKINKNNIFITGPTGTGKTYMCQSLAKVLNIPVCVFDATQYTETGYIGMEISSIIPAAYRTAGGKMGKLNPCIIFIDEIDKIAASKDGTRRDVGGRGVQQELLKLLECDNYIVEVSPGREKLPYDISNVLFIVAGAFADLRPKERAVGFAPGANKTEESKMIENLENYGFIPEFLGRFSSFIELNALSKENLREILLNSEESIITGYRSLFAGCKAELKIPEEKLEEILEAAHQNNTGARGLMQALSAIIKEQMFDMTLESTVIQRAA